MTLRLRRFAALLFGLFLPISPLLAAQSQTERFPPLATSDSPWNVLAFGGKGQMHGAPICGSLSFLSSSPKALDFDADFFNEKASDLIAHADLTLVGTMSGRKIYNLELTVHSRHDNTADQPTQPTLGAVLVQRGQGEYCDIYQNQYAYDPTHEENEIVILHVDGQDLLKVYQTDNHTYFIEYWEMTDHGPARLDLDGLYRAILSGLPSGGEVRWVPALDLTDPEVELDVENSHGTSLGTLDVSVAVQGTRLVIVKKSLDAVLANHVSV